MRGYNLCALCIFLVQTQPDKSIPCELYPPGANPCMPPDPNPFFHFTVVMCISVAVGLIWFYLFGAASREHDSTMSEDEFREWPGRITEALSVIKNKKGPDRREGCRLIVQGLLLSVTFTLREVREYYADHEPKEKDALTCILSILHSGRDLLTYLAVTSFMLRFPPLSSLAAELTLEGVKQYREFVDVVQCCNANLPDFAKTLPVFEL